jgi:hypothetical protein
VTIAYVRIILVEISNIKFLQNSLTKNPTKYHKEKLIFVVL